LSVLYVGKLIEMAVVIIIAVVSGEILMYLGGYLHYTCSMCMLPLIDPL